VLYHDGEIVICWECSHLKPEYRGGKRLSQAENRRGFGERNILGNRVLSQARASAARVRSVQGLDVYCLSDGLGEKRGRPGRLPSRGRPQSLFAGGARGHRSDPLAPAEVTGGRRCLRTGAPDRCLRPRPPAGWKTPLQNTGRPYPWRKTPRNSTGNSIGSTAGSGTGRLQTPQGQPQRRVSGSLVEDNRCRSRRAKEGLTHHGNHVYFIP